MGAETRVLCRVHGVHYSHLQSLLAHAGLQQGLIARSWTEYENIAVGFAQGEQLPKVDMYVCAFDLGFVQPVCSLYIAFVKLCALCARDLWKCVHCVY